jgi:hypothetical protein
MNAVLTTSLIQAIYAFALMAVIAMICAGVIKLIVGALARSTKAASVVAAPVVAAPVPVAAAAKPAAFVPTAADLSNGAVSDELAIIIAAACHAVIGAHRIVYLAETHRAANWTTEMRTRHHLSHVPHR